MLKFIKFIWQLSSEEIKVLHRNAQTSKLKKYSSKFIMWKYQKSRPGGQSGTTKPVGLENTQESCKTLDGYVL